MPRRERGYIETNVLDEAKKRLHHVFDLFDTVSVAFSGGKDSLAALHLVKEVRDERGITRPVPVIFRDEELIPQRVIDFIAEYRELEWVDLRWFCIPLESTKYVLGKSERYVQWDPNRQHVRQMPEGAITLETLGLPADLVMDQYTADTITTRGMPGKVAIVNGIRADESLNRYSAMMVKLNEPYIVATKDKGAAKRVNLVKPIYDWTERDVFRYFYDRGIRYCPVYDAQLWAGHSLRVSSPLHAEAAKHLHDMRAHDPDLYAAMIEVFPEAMLQERYYRELDRDATREKYGADLDGVQRWIEDNLTDRHQRAKALRELARVRKSARHSPNAYPPGYILKEVMAGAYKRPIKPLVGGSQGKAAYT